MPRTVGQKTEKTKEALAVEKAKADYTEAVKKGGDKPNDAQTKAIAAAKAHYETAAKADRRERFLRIGTRRVSDIIVSLTGLPKLFNAKHYDFTVLEAAKINDALDKAVTDAKTAITLAAATPAGKTAEATKVFSLV